MLGLSRLAWACAAVSAVLVGLAVVMLWPPGEHVPAALRAPERSGPLLSLPAEGPIAPAVPVAMAQPGVAPVDRAASGARSAGGVFESDASGRLVLDARMRLAVESLVGLSPADALPGLAEAEVKGLPAEAAEAARALVLRMDEYQAAQRAAFAPGEAPLVPQEGMAELEALVALRSSYFGADAARRMFGEDEAVARRLLQLMAEDPSSSLSMVQKASRAQERYDQERRAVPAGK